MHENIGGGNSKNPRAEAWNSIKYAMIIAGRLLLVDYKINSEQDGVKSGSIFYIFYGPNFIFLSFILLHK